MYRYISVFLVLFLGIFLLSCGDDDDSIVNSVDTTAPAAVSNLRIMDDVDSTCILTWTATGDDDSAGTAASYDLRYATDSATLLLWTNAVQFPVPFSPNQQGRLELMEIDGLDPDTQYYFALKVSDESDNESDISNIASEGPPDKPTITLTSPQTNTALGDYVVITADASDNVGVAYVKFFIGDEFVGSDLVPPYSVLVLYGDYYSHGRQISLFAQAFDTDLNVSGSQVVYCTIDTALFAPDASTLSSSVVVTDSSVTLEWTGNDEPDFEKYSILYDTLDFSGTHAASFSIDIDSKDDTTAMVTGLIDTIDYYLQIATEDEFGNVGYGNMVTVTTANRAPAAPLLTAVYRNVNEIKIGWSASLERDFQDYRVYRSLDDNVTTDDLLLATITNRATATYTDDAVDTGIVYYYGVIVSDAYGLSSQSNTIEVTSDFSSYALEFNGSDNYCIVPHYAALDFTTTFTIEAWVYPYSNSAFARIVDKTESTCCLQYSLLLSDGYIGTDIGRQMTSSYSRNQSNQAVPLNSWHHIALTYDAGTVTYYYDGLPVDTNTIAITYLSAFATDLNFGRRLLYNEFYFHGLIDEIRIWNIERSDSDIAATYNSILTGSEPGLVGYWTFDEGVGQTAHALVGNDCQLGSTSGVDTNDPTWVVSSAPMKK
ncbi:MAG: LamG-like jellyroll fold domain-containing protein [Candidatus Zixiibacteriota bacterium]